jgi:membrane protein
MARAKRFACGLGGLTWKELGRRLWKQTEVDNAWGHAAQLSYYFLLALFPLLLLLTALFGIFADTGSTLRHNLLDYLGRVLPNSASQLVNTTIDEISQAAGGGKISFGILATLWAASNGMGAISEALNAAYETEETRPWWKVRLISIALTLALAVLIITALALTLSGGEIAQAIAAHAGFGGVFTSTWKIIQWPLVLVFVLISFSLIYYFAPDLKDQDWKWVTPGTIVGVALWLLVSFGFRTYLRFFNSYSTTYGSLGAVIILMLWFYLTGMAILIGGEINSIVEHAAAKRGAPDAKESGEKSPREAEHKGRKTKAKRAGRAAKA